VGSCGDTLFQGVVLLISNSEEVLVSTCLVGSEHQEFMHQHGVSLGNSKSALSTRHTTGLSILLISLVLCLFGFLDDRFSLCTLLLFLGGFLALLNKFLLGLELLDVFSLMLGTGLTGFRLDFVSLFSDLVRNLSDSIGLFLSFSLMLG